LVCMLPGDRGRGRSCAPELESSGGL
jgi:hypothetical protein